MKNELQVLQNIIAFMDRVEVKGRAEVQEYANCCNYVEERIEGLKNPAKEKAPLKKAN